MTLIEPGQSPSGQGMLSGHGISQDAVSPGDAPRLPGDGCRRGSVRFMHRGLKKRDESRLSLICCSCIKWILLFVCFCLTHLKCPGLEIPVNPAFFFPATEIPQNLHCKNQLLPDFVLILLIFWIYPHSSHLWRQLLQHLGQLPLHNLWWRLLPLPFHLQLRPSQTLCGRLQGL